jgi:O-antigen/teichoic acid export membrane protein
MKPLTRDAAWVLASHAAAAVATLAVQVILARSLATAVFGAFLLAQAIVNVVEATVTARAGEVATYWLGRTWKDEFPLARGYARYLARRELRWNIIAAVLLGLAALLLGEQLQIDAWLIAALALAIPLQASYGVSKTLFIVAGRLRQQAAFEISHSVGYCVLALVLVSAFGVPGFVVAYLFMTLAKTLVAGWWVRRFWPSGLHAPALRPPALGLSGFSVVRSVSVNISQQADVILLGLFASKEGVALYKVARTVASLPTRLAGPVWAVLRPRVLACLRANDLVEVRRLLRRPALALFGLGILALPLAYFWLDDLLALLYGAQYAASAPMALLLLAGVWLLFGVSGWLVFIAVITANKLLATSLFVSQAVLVLLAGLIARGDGLLLAALSACAMAMITAFAWVTLYAKSARFALLRL